MKYINLFEDYMSPRIGSGSQNFKPLGHDKFKVGDIVKSKNQSKFLNISNKYFKIIQVDIEEKEGLPYKVQDILNNYSQTWVNETDVVSTTPEEVEDFKIKQLSKKYNVL